MADLMAVQDAKEICNETIRYIHLSMQFHCFNFYRKQLNCFKDFILIASDMLVVLFLCCLFFFHNLNVIAELFWLFFCFLFLYLFLFFFLFCFVFFILRWSQVDFRSADFTSILQCTLSLIFRWVLLMSVTQSSIYEIDR